MEQAKDLGALSRQRASTRNKPFLGLDRVARRKMMNHFMTVLLTLATLISVSILMIIVFDIAKEGIQAIDWNFLTRSRRYTPPVGERIVPAESGIAHAIQGTLIMTGSAALIAVPLGLMIAIYLSEFGRGIYAQIVRFIIDLMLQIPSIVIGIFVWATFVQIWGFSGRAGAVALAMIMTPIVVRSVEEVLRLVPQHLREAGWALGVPRWRVVIQVVIPTVAPGIVTGIVLALARAAGESAPILLAALGSASMNANLERPMHAIPLLVYDYTAQPYGLEDKAWGAALILILMMAVVNGLLRMSLGRKKFEN
jgi:phosphate transport system permease protein